MIDISDTQAGHPEGRFREDVIPWQDKSARHQDAGRRTVMGTKPVSRANRCEDFKLSGRSRWNHTPRERLDCPRNEARLSIR